LDGKGIEKDYEKMMARRVKMMLNHDSSDIISSSSLHNLFVILTSIITTYHHSSPHPPLFQDHSKPPQKAKPGAPARRRQVTPGRWAIFLAVA
jgi:hypothetical protein